MTDEIALVNLDDEIIGYESKAAVHQKGSLHRAFSVFIINGPDMLLQKRNVNKYHSGGLWSNACCSHQRKGEELREAVHRRLKEEAGFDCDLEEVFSFVYRTVFPDGLIEYELDHVWVGFYDGPVQADPEEIDEIRWVDREQLKQELLHSPERFSSWFITGAPKVLAYLEEHHEGLGRHTGL